METKTIHIAAIKPYGLYIEDGVPIKDKFSEERSNTEIVYSIILKMLQKYPACDMHFIVNTHELTDSFIKSPTAHRYLSVMRKNLFVTALGRKMAILYLKLENPAFRMLYNEMKELKQARTSQKRQKILNAIHDDGED